MNGIKFDRAADIIKNCENKKIAVIGDIMLDRFFWGAVSRVSPEAPVPVVDLENETYHLGGAANVANNLKSLGINAMLCGVLGNGITSRILVIPVTNSINLSKPKPNPA